MTCQIIRLADRRPRPAPLPPLWAELVAWWLAWSANSAQAAADTLHAMAAMVGGRR